MHTRFYWVGQKVYLIFPTRWYRNVQTDFLANPIHLFPMTNLIPGQHGRRRQDGKSFINCKRVNQLSDSPRARRESPQFYKGVQGLCDGAHPQQSLPQPRAPCMLVGLDSSPTSVFQSLGKPPTLPWPRPCLSPVCLQDSTEPRSAKLLEYLRQREMRPIFETTVVHRSSKTLDGMWTANITCTDLLSDGELLEDRRSSLKIALISLDHETYTQRSGSPAPSVQCRFPGMNTLHLDSVHF